MKEGRTTSPYAIPRYNLGMKPYIIVSLVAVLLYALWGDGEPLLKEGEYVDAPGRAPSAPLETLVARCAECHGERGEKSDGETPYIGGQNVDYLLFAMRTYAMGLRRHEAMERAILDINLQDVKRLAAHYASQEVVWRGEGFGGHGEALHLADPVAEGELLARERCLGCHDGERAADLDALDFRTQMATLLAYHRGEGVSGAKAEALEGLTRHDLERIAFFFAANDEGPEARHFRSPRQLSKVCNTCHGYNGHSQNASRPALSGQAEGYILKALRAYQSGERDNAAMFKITQGLSALELAAIADFYARQE